MQTYEKTKKAYKEILSVINKHRDTCDYDYDKMVSESKIHLFGIELKEKYGLDVGVGNITSINWNDLQFYRVIGLFGERHMRTISWEDDGKQPEDEFLLKISFSTGAYIFGDDYPEKLFKKMWLEIKSYDYKYIDTANKSIYFSLDNSKDIFNKMPSIVEKYKEQYRKESKQRKIEELEERLSKLKD